MSHLTDAALAAGFGVQVDYKSFFVRSNHAYDVRQHLTATAYHAEGCLKAMCDTLGCICYLLPSSADKWDQDWARCPRSTCNASLYKRKCISCGWSPDE